MTKTDKKPAGWKREETRKRILEAVGRSFRQHGFAGVGVDAIAKEAGVTSGAFYAHLGSKDAAFELAVEAGLNEVIDAVPIFQTENGGGWVQAFADYYLGAAHRDDLETGCAMTTLTPEIARQSSSLNVLYERKMQTIADLIAKGLVGDDTSRMNRAWAMLSIFTGGLNLSRAIASNGVTEQVASTVKETVVLIAGETADLRI